MKGFQQGKVQTSNVEPLAPEDKSYDSGVRRWAVLVWF